MPSSAKPCPICDKPAKERFAPFCSDRCRNVDLHRWFTGSYAAPAEEADDWDGEEEIGK